MSFDSNAWTPLLVATSTESRYIINVHNYNNFRAALIVCRHIPSPFQQVEEILLNP